MKEAVAMLERLPFVERYAWFAMQRFKGANDAVANSHLTDDTCKLIQRALLTAMQLYLICALAVVALAINADAAPKDKEKDKRSIIILDKVKTRTKAQFGSRYRQHRLAFRDSCFGFRRRQPLFCNSPDESAQHKSPS
jgi:hypothetical protein